jgi:effector-binding domain-containing protein
MATEVVMKYQVDVQRLPAQRVAAIRTHAHVDGIPRTMAGAFKELYEHLAASGIAPTGPPTAVYSEVDENQGVTVEICVPVAQDVGAHGRVIADELAAETVVTTMHRGPYEELPKAYEALSMYMQEHHFGPSGWMREQYLNGPPDTSPKDFETIVQWPAVLVPDTAQKLVEHLAEI